MGIEPAGWEVPSFISQVNDVDREAYRLAIERWETEGGATLEPDDAANARARGTRHAQGKVSM